MIHFDEHTLELYVLNSSKVAEQQDRIEAHLLVCHGCRTLVDEMSAFHEELAGELKEAPLPSETTAIARRKQAIESYFEPLFTPQPQNAIVRSFRTFTLFARNNPVMAAATGFAFLASFAGLFYFASLKTKTVEPIKNLNPEYYNFNTAQNLLEVYNGEDEVIWDARLENAEEYLKRDNKQHYEVLLADMDADGNKEILTKIKKLNKTPIEPHYLTIINLASQQETKIMFEREFQYLHRKDYSFKFNTGMILTEGKSVTAPNILIGCPNILRSPYFLARLDNTGKTIGRYWHFGQMGQMYKLDFNRDGTDELVLCGVNDSRDTTNEEFAAFAILDPSKINGDSKSTATPGFDMPLSNAELLYVQFPLMEPRNIFNSAPTVREMAIEGDDLYHFEVYYHDGDIKETPVTFHFYFTRNMQIKSVKSHNVTNRFMEKLYNEGKIQTRLNAQFFEHLKNGVRYWDGKAWHKEWTMVKQN